MTNQIKRVLRQWLWMPVAVLLAVIPLALMHFLQFFTLPLMPINRRLFRFINTSFAGVVWGSWALALQKIDGTVIDVFGDSLPQRENAIVICNHQQMGDIVVLAALAVKARYVAHMKWLIKDAVKYVPGIGWGLLLLDCVFLKRDWTRDEATIRRVFSNITRDKLPLWLCSFPEGTRATAAKLRASQEASRLRHIEPLQHLITPKTKGFSASVMALRGHVKAVYSVTLGYEGGVPSLLGMVRGDVRRVVVEVRRFAIESLPMDESSLASWLKNEFRRKDEVVAAFIKEHGCRTALNESL
jgi:1-acyl-sn-glycerol-3-phosphate acyltransferase